MPENQCFSYTVIRERDEKILRIDCDTCNFLPSLEENPIVMSRTIDILQETGQVTKLVYHQKRDYEYDFSQSAMLYEIAKLYNDIVSKQGLITYETAGLNTKCQTCLGSRFTEMQEIVYRILRRDPLHAYTELKRLRRSERVSLETSMPECSGCETKFMQILDKIISDFEKTRLIKLAASFLPGYNPKDRTAYRRLFRPSIKPDFMFTKLLASYPSKGEEIASYDIKDTETEVTIFKFPDSSQYLYHIIPPEFRLTEDKYEILDLAKKILSEHKPTKEEFVDPERMREVFYNVGRDLITELANYRGIKYTEQETESLAKILVRYTVGFGLIEVLLSDQNIQDISINSPMGQIPIFIVHGEFSDCKTNIIPTTTEAESWASKLRLISGRPLDEANQILDTEIEIPGARARVAAITEPFNPTGIAYSFRRHRDKPWTLPLFMKTKMLNPLAAGLFSFLIDGTRSILIAGTRSSGKTSLLGSMLIEIMRRYRIITIEDTLEIPGESLRKLGYNIQSLKVASALASGSSEINATTGIRSTLRLGDSALIVGEVRSEEALALYEAMRVGAAANVVAGTVHAASPYGVYDRVVNDIGVPKTSFKATDIIIVANPIKSASGIERVRRVLSVSEVRKDWENDPLRENAFVDLMKYDIKQDQLVPTDDLINGDSEVLKTIAGNIKELAGNWDSVWNNILLRAEIKKQILDISLKSNNLELLEAPFVLKCNDTFHNMMDKVREETGGLDTKRIEFEFSDWIKKEVKR